MSLLAFGINHNTAPLALRERLAFAPESLKTSLQTAQRAGDLNEVVILSTCNRTEIYASSDGDEAALQNWLVEVSQVAPDVLAKSAYCYRDHAALEHMMQVAGGLDSLVLGEPQILGQMKTAYAAASEAGTLGGELHNGLQQVFNIAKRVRSETAIGENPVSVAYAAVSLAQQIFSDLKNDTALLIGAGETIELVARHLKENGIHKMIVANRTLERAEKVASEFGARAIVLGDIPSALHEADIVISSTASPLPILGKGAVESALKKRKHKPMFMLDIAVPRDIEAQVGELEDVYLYTVDDLHAVIDENKKSRAAAADHARDIIKEGVADYERQQRALNAVGVIKALREQVDSQREQELQKALKQLQAGANPEQVLAQFARSLTNKLLHAPTTALKEASANGRQQTLAMVREMYQLTLPDTMPTPTNLDSSEPK